MSDSGSGSEDEWEEEYRRSLDNDESDEDEDEHEHDVDTSPAGPQTAHIDANAPVASTSSLAQVPNSGSHVLQALDEVWAQLGEQHVVRHTALRADELYKQPSAVRHQSSCDTLQHRLGQEHERDPYGGAVTSSAPVVSEQWLVYQLLLLYQRLDNALYVWSGERQQYELRQRVCTPQVSTSAVESLSSAIAEHVSLLQHIHTFVDRHCHFSSTTSHCLQAFGHSLRAYLHTHDREVWHFENDMYAAASKRLLTVLALRNHMQPHKQYVRTLYHVIQHFVSHSTATCSIAEQSSRLLSMLYTEYEARSLLTDSTLSALSLCLLLDTLFPYVELLDERTGTGRLNGSETNELRSRRGANSQLALDVSDRSTANSTTHCPSFLQPVNLLISCTSDNERLLTKLQQQQAETNPSLTAATKNHSKPLLQLFRQSFLSFFPALHISSAVPPTQPATIEVQARSSVAPADVAAPSAAESAVINEWMDSGGPSSGLFSVVGEPMSASLVDQPSLAHICPAPADDPTLLSLLKPHHFPLPASSILDPLSSTTPSLLSVEWVDPYIAQLQQSATVAVTSPPAPAGSVDVAEDASLSSVVHAAVSSSTFSSPQPARMIESCLLSHIRERYTTSSQRVLHALLKECGLVSCLLSLRSLYLSFDGVMTSDLLSAIRELSSSTAEAGSMARIQDIVNECAVSSTACSQWYKRHPIAVSSIDRSYSIFSLSLAISSSSSHSASSLSPSSFSSLSALLQKLSFVCAIPWPLDSIVTVEHVGQYDAVFHFILQLNCALHTLARLPSLLLTRRKESAAYSALPHPLSHSFYLLRAAVHHSVAVLHSYVLSQATGSAWDELAASVSLSSPLATQSTPSIVQSLHSAHCRYLDRVLLVCLLAPSMAAVMSAVQRLLGVVAGVEEVAGTVADYLHTTIDDWQPEQWSKSAVVPPALSFSDESAEVEQRAIRRQWRMALSNDEQEALRVEYDAHKDGLYVHCQRRCEEVRDEYHHTVVFLLMVLGKIVHSGAHPHLAPLLLNLNYNHHFSNS